MYTNAQIHYTIFCAFCQGIFSEEDFFGAHYAYISSSAPFFSWKYEVKMRFCPKWLKIIGIKMNLINKYITNFDIK